MKKCNSIDESFKRTFLIIENFMEKLDLKNLRTIQRKNSFASIHSNENKFRKVNF